MANPNTRGYTYRPEEKQPSPDEQRIQEMQSRRELQRTLTQELTGALADAVQDQRDTRPNEQILDEILAQRYDEGEGGYLSSADGRALTQLGDRTRSDSEYSKLRAAILERLPKELNHRKEKQQYEQSQAQERQKRNQEAAEQKDSDVANFKLNNETLLPLETSFGDLKKDTEKALDAISTDRDSRKPHLQKTMDDLRNLDIEVKGNGMFAAVGRKGRKEKALNTLQALDDLRKKLTGALDAVLDKVKKIDQKQVAAVDKIDLAKYYDSESRQSIRQRKSITAETLAYPGKVEGNVTKLKYDIESSLDPIKIARCRELVEAV